VLSLKSEGMDTPGYTSQWQPSPCYVHGAKPNTGQWLLCQPCQNIDAHMPTGAKQVTQMSKAT
jgi:hypothetical protein